MHSSIWNMAAGMNFSPQSYLATAALSQQFAAGTVSIIEFTTNFSTYTSLKTKLNCLKKIIEA